MNYDINGIIVRTSSLGRSGFHGACFSPSWTLDENHPFVAAVVNPKEPEYQSLLRAKSRTSLHLGYYADPREASYAVAYYEKNKEEVLSNMLNYGQNGIEIPDMVYNIPVTFTLDDAKKAIYETSLKNNGMKISKKNNKFKINNEAILDAVCEVFAMIKTDTNTTRIVASKAREFLVKSKANNHQELFDDAFKYINDYIMVN